jgi:uncharacterized phiE125 gp8 family phage protein
MTAPKPLHDVEFEPVSLAEAQLHLRLDLAGSPPSHPDDGIVDALIVAAREYAEYYTGQAFARQSYSLKLQEFNQEQVIDLGVWPVLSVQSVTYLDEDGQSQTLSTDDYLLDNQSKPARIVAKHNARWPTALDQANSIEVLFTAGCTDASPNDYPVPKSVKQAILLTLGHLYENRETVTGSQKYQLPMGAESLLQIHRIAMGM